MENQDTCSDRTPDRMSRFNPITRYLFLLSPPLTQKALYSSLGVLGLPAQESLPPVEVTTVSVGEASTHCCPSLSARPLEPPLQTASYVCPFPALIAQKSVGLPHLQRRQEQRAE